MMLEEPLGYKVFLATYTKKDDRIPSLWGAALNVLTSTSVELGRSNSDGTSVPGSTISIEVGDGGLRFGPDQSDNGEADSFEIRIGDGFSKKDVSASK